MAIRKIKNKQVVVTSNFDFGGNRIISLADPIDNSDAVTLGYLTGNTISTSLSGLTDTNISTTTQGQILTYDSNEGKWINDDTISGNLTIIGDLYVSGTTVTIDVDNMNIGDNIILINSGETSTGVTLVQAGLEVDRGTGTNYRFVFDEFYSAFRIGEIGSEQSVATRQDNPTDTGIPYWNDTSSRFDTSSNLVFNGTNLFIPSMSSQTQVNAVYFNTSTGQLTYGSASAGSVTSVTSLTTNQLTVADTTSTPKLSIVTGVVADSGTALATGDQIYDFVTGLGYTTNTGTVTSVAAGDGLDFTSITTTGSVILGLPSTITSGSTNNVTSISHNHTFMASTFVTGTDGILVVGNKFKIDDLYVNEQTLPNLYSYTGITSNQDLGSLPSGQTLGMVYITNNGTADASVNLGTTALGTDISPYTPITVASGDTVSVTVNIRLSNTEDKIIYINSDDWTNVNLDVEWAHISYQNSSLGGGSGTVIEVSSITTNQLTVINTTTAPQLSIVTGAVTDAGTALATGDQIYDFVTGLGYGTVSAGGTGLSTVSNNAILTGNGTSALTAETGLTYDGSLLTVTGSLKVTEMALSATTYGVFYDPSTSGFTYAEGGASGSGGFLGTVTKDTTEPSDLSNNQWVTPAPQSDGTYEYTFDNFSDSGATPITVNLAEETVYLRYVESGDYWAKESYNKPLSQNKTWIGNSNSEAKEVEVVDEWGNTSGVTDIGQKYDQQTQTLMRVSAPKISYIQNFVFVQDIDLSILGNTKIIENESGKKLLIKNIKLIILNTANPVSFTVNVGTNTSSYNNIVNAQNIQDVIVDEYYNLTQIILPAGSDGTIVDISSDDLYFRVSSTNASTLNAHLLMEGFIY